MQTVEQLNKKTLLASIKPGMKRLTKDFLKRIYGYGVTDASFPDKAITALENAECSKARAYYENWVNEYEAARDAELKKAAHWFRRECETKWERKQEEGEERRKRRTQSRSQSWEELYRILDYQ